MQTPRKAYSIIGNQLMVDYSLVYCDTPAGLLGSDLFHEVVERFVGRLAKKETYLHNFLRETIPGKSVGETAAVIVNLFRLLITHTADEIPQVNAEYGGILERREDFSSFKEELYNFWRRLERVAYMEIPPRREGSKSEIHYIQFIKVNQDLKKLVLYTNRKITENLLGANPRVFRQLPAWANMGMLVRKVAWNCPERLAMLREIPFVRHTLIEPPLILYPKSNKRKGKFEEIDSVSGEMLKINPSDWFCFPAKIADMVAFVYFHRNFSSLALSMSNLFEIAANKDIEGKLPDVLMLFGVSPETIPHNTVFHFEKELGMHIGLVSNRDEMDYFGYFKKMALTLHNVEMIRRGGLPIHGAMVSITLKGGGCANVAFVGDSGAGKSETLEALRVLAEDYIQEMRIIFDDMGSLRIKDGRVFGYGTETGAFVRIDDLSPGYAYEQIDRSIFMNPHMHNARLIIPVSTYDDITRGYPVDMLLYANNYELTDNGKRAIEFFRNRDEALGVFRTGARMAKGTTDEKGLVQTYFANPFGAPQRREEHERIAEKFFETMFATGVKVGQIRTCLGIEGFEQEGPRSASIELFEVIKKFSCR